MTGQRICLRGLGPQLEKKSWESDRQLQIGRLESLEVMINDVSISRRHAEIAYTADVWVVRDLGSTNGTYLNGVRVGRADQPLRKGDIIQCGDASVVIAALEADDHVSIETPGAGLQVECAVQNSWEQALLGASPLEQMASVPPRHQLLALLRCGRDFSELTTLESLLDTILHDAVTALGAEGGAILLADPATGQFQGPIVTTYGAPGGGHVSKSLAQRAMSAGESLLCQDVDNDLDPADSRHFRSEGISSLICALLRTRKRRLGVLQLERRPRRLPFSRNDLALADALTANVSSTIESVGAFLTRERDLFVQTLTALAQTVELRDDYTGSHTQRVTDYAVMIGEELDLTAIQRQHLRMGTPLHDIGKIGISDAILRKPGRLTPEELEYMKSHTWKGATLLEGIPPLRPLIPIARNHHERWDGGGYPDRLAGEETPLLARIVAVADAFDAMTTDRPYRPAMPLEKAFAEISRHAGTQFDPNCADAMLRCKARIEEMLDEQKKLYETIAYAPSAPLPLAAKGPAVHSGSRARTLAISPEMLSQVRDKARQGSR